jgi:hypothetical protein
MSRPPSGEIDRTRRVRVVLAEVWPDRIKPGSCPPTAADIEHALQRVGLTLERPDRSVP